MTSDDSLLAPLLESWDRHNAVLLNLLHALPPGGLDARATPTSHTVAELFTHMHHERMISVLEDAPEHAGAVPSREWEHEPDTERIAQLLRESGRRVRDAVGGRIGEGRSLDRDFAHPLVLLHFLIFHEGYHHGQVKLALKVAGSPIPDEVAGPATWHVSRAR